MPREVPDGTSVATGDGLTAVTDAVAKKMTVHAPQFDGKAVDGWTAAPVRGGSTNGAGRSDGNAGPGPTG